MAVVQGCYTADMSSRLSLMAPPPPFPVKLSPTETSSLLLTPLPLFPEVLVPVPSRRLLRRPVFWRSGSRADGLRSWLPGRSGRWVLGMIFHDRRLIKFSTERYRLRPIPNPTRQEGSKGRCPQGLRQGEEGFCLNSRAG